MGEGGECNGKEQLQYPFKKKEEKKNILECV
jgi:hypothetical protein